MIVYTHIRQDKTAGIPFHRMGKLDAVEPEKKKNHYQVYMKDL